MKKPSVIIALSSLALTLQAALPQPDLIAQIYFAGSQKISASPHADAFTVEFASPEALALRRQTADKLAGWLSGWLQPNAVAAVPNGPAKLRPLFDDLQRSEFLLEIRAAVGGQPEAAIAIKLDPARAQLWQANLKPFFAAATFKTTGDWLIFDSNPALLGLGAKVAQKLTTPPAAPFTLDVNWPRLAQWHPKLKELGLPETQFTVTAPDNSPCVNGKFYFPQDLTLNLEPWKMPTNTMHAPFNSFIAARGFSSWFQSQAWAKPCQISPAPNQLFVWSQSPMPFATYAAVPVPNAQTAISQAYGRLSSALGEADARGELMTPAKPVMSATDINVTGVPFMAPRFKPVTEPGGQFLFAELFPNTPAGLPLPAGLTQRLATKNLVYYNWENTATRIPQLLQINQLCLMLSLHKQLDGRSAGFRWMQKAAAIPGTMETGITQTMPSEFTFLRQGPGVFTAMELFTLASWLEAPNFPGCDLPAPPGYQPATQPSNAPVAATRH
jgi:hypothetical protein